MCNVRQRSNVTDISKWVGRCFGKQQLGGGLHSRSPLRDIGLRDKRSGNTKLGELGTDEFDGGAKHGVRTNNVVATFEQTHAHQQNRRHTSRCSDSGLRAFHGRQTLLKAAHRWVAQARVGITLFLTCEPSCGHFGAGLDIAAGQKQGFRIFTVLARGHASMLGMGFCMPS